MAGRVCLQRASRAALELTEAVTLISERQVPDEIYESAAAHFNGAELVNLVFAIATINTGTPSNYLQSQVRRLQSGLRMHS